MTDKRIAELQKAGVEFIRVTYPDLHGICRGKEIPIEVFAAAAEHGIHQTEAIMTVDLAHNVVAGFEHGFRDYVNIPDLATLVQLPFDPTVAMCLSDGRSLDGSPYDTDPRGALRAAIARFDALGYTAICAPELEFYIVDPDTFTPYAPRFSSVYTCGDIADPKGVLRAITIAARDLGLQPIASAHEYGCGQYEINLAHSEALDAVDRSFRLKDLVKTIAARHGLLATFMGRLFDHDDGSGMHLHLSLERKGKNAFDDANGRNGLSDLAYQFGAGVLAHITGLTAILNPTVNAYRRLVVESLAPTHVNWGDDNRLALLRFPPERGGGARIEVRSADGTANLHLAAAGLLAAGLDGVERKLTLPEPIEGNPYETESLGDALPNNLGAALAALEGDALLVGALGEQLVARFLEIKRYELDRWHAELAKVTDWERREYAPHL